MLDIEAALIASAVEAFRTTRFYGDLYDVEPTQASSIPFITASTYHKAAGLLDCVSNREAMIGVLPPYVRDASRFPFVAPEDEPELVLRQRRIVRAFGDLGVDFKAAPRLLIVADDRTGPFACELAKGIYWEGCQASITYLDGQAEDVRRVVDEYDPDYVLLASGRSLGRVLDRPPSSVILVEHCTDRPVDDSDFPALLYADGVDLIGSRALGRNGYDVDPEQLLVELEPASQLSHVTKLRATCLPMVRFGIGRRIPIAEGSHPRSP